MLGQVPIPDLVSGKIAGLGGENHVQTMFLFVDFPYYLDQSIDPNITG